MSAQAWLEGEVQEDDEDLERLAAFLGLGQLLSASPASSVASSPREAPAPSPSLEASAAAAAGPTAPTSKRRCWAFVDESSTEDFETEVPDPAITFSFELDTFQKRAIRHVEKSEHVLVSAHTSAGKTAVAEYAIAHAFRQGRRAIYTSPIKALSNQKFREFSKRFEGMGSVGIVTGDVAVNPDADCVIMTTEILRSMLYRGDRGLQDVSWVIFDEVHYINDAERGVVWEEVIILLPPQTSLLMLSATVPNYQEFAGWVGRTKRRPVYTVYTTYRPTPLRHFVHFHGKTFPLLDDDGLNLKAFSEMRELQSERLKPPVRKARPVTVTFESKPFGMSAFKGEPSGDGASAEAGGSRSSAASAYVVEKVNSNDPSRPAWRLGVRPGWVLVGVNGVDVRGMPLEAIQTVSKDAELPATLDFEVPPKENSKQQQQQQQQPQQKVQTWESRERAETQRLQALLRELEAADLLPTTVFVFSRRRVETLAGEMRNLDLCTKEEKSKAHVFLNSSLERLCAEDRALPQVQRAVELAGRGIGIHHGGLLPLVKEAVEILFSRGLVKVLFATETFAMGVNMPARSVIFTAWVKHDGARPRALMPGEYTQMAGRAGRRGLDSEGRVYLLCGDEPPNQSQITTMLTHRAERLSSRFRVTFAMILQLRRFAKGGVKVEDVMGHSFMENVRAMQRPAVRRDLAQRTEALDQLPAVACVFGEPPIEEYARLEEEARSSAGPLLELLQQPQLRGKALCVGRCLRAWKLDEFASSLGVLVSWSGGRDDTLLVAVLTAGDIDDGGASASRAASALGSDVRAQVQAGWVVRLATIPLANVVQLFDHCVAADACSAAETGEGTSGLRALGAELLRLADSGLDQPLSLSKMSSSRHVGMEHHDLLQRQRRLHSLQAQSKCHTCPLREAHLDESRSRRTLVAEIEDLDRQLGAESLGLLPQLQAREQVLRSLGCLDGGGFVTVKGRAATEALSGDEVTLVEVVTAGALDAATPAELAAAVSAFVFPDKADDEAERAPLPKPLLKIREAMLAQHRRVEGLLRQHRVDVDAEEFAKMCNVGLMGIAYRWACGVPLADIMQDTWLQEGTIVRAIVRTEELLRKLQETARFLGRPSLRQACRDAAELIRRDIAFTPSLYLE